MQSSIVFKILLAVLGLILLAAGGFALFNPAGFAVKNGANLAGNLVLLNDYRAMGALIFGSGIVTALGLLHHRMAFTSVVVAAMAFWLWESGGYWPLDWMAYQKAH